MKAAVARRVKLLALDVDGVLTDGAVCYSSSGEELKSFNIRDGLGIKLLQRAGIEVSEEEITAGMDRDADDYADALYEALMQRYTQLTR